MHASNTQQGAIMPMKVGFNWHLIFPSQPKVKHQLCHENHERHDIASELYASSSSLQA